MKQSNKGDSLTILTERYSIPLATWYANETKSLYVRGLMSGRVVRPIVTRGCSYPEHGGRLSRRKSRKFP